MSFVLRVCPQNLTLPSFEFVKYRLSFLKVERFTFTDNIRLTDEGIPRFFPIENLNLTESIELSNMRFTPTVRTQVFANFIERRIYTSILIFDNQNIFSIKITPQLNH